MKELLATQPVTLCDLVPEFRSAKLDHYSAFFNSATNQFFSNCIELT